MLEKYPKLTMIICLTLGLSLGFLAGIRIKAPASENTTQHPVRSITINVNTDQRDELFSQLRRFADKWNYAILIDPFGPNGEEFRIGLWREDMKLIGFYPTDPGTLFIGFYSTNPTDPSPEFYFDREIRDLKVFVGEIPGVIISVEE